MKINEATLAELCALSYKDPACLTGTLFELCDSIYPIQNSGSEAVVAVTGRTAIVVIRGTQKSWLDILRDLQFLFPKSVNVGKVHRGFLRAANKLKQAGLYEMLEELDVDCVWFAGHSLGGATAAILAVDAISWGIDGCQINLFSIGQPRVGNTEWASHSLGVLTGCGGQVFRFTHPNDPITKLPPHGMTFLPKYRHLDDAKIIVSPTQIIDGESFVESVMATIVSVVGSPKAIVQAHSSATYVLNLSNWVRHREHNGMESMIRSSKC